MHNIIVHQLISCKQHRR